MGREDTPLAMISTLMTGAQRLLNWVASHLTSHLLQFRFVRATYAQNLGNVGARKRAFPRDREISRISVGVSSAEVFSSSASYIL